MIGSCNAGSLRASRDGGCACGGGGDGDGDEVADIGDNGGETVGVISPVLTVDGDGNFILSMSDSDDEDLDDGAKRPTCISIDEGEGGKFFSSPGTQTVNNKDSFLQNIIKLT